MVKKIEIIGVNPKRIEVVDRPKRRVEPEELAAALGASPIGQTAARNLDPIALAELGTELVSRLRSSGGRPALADATIYCRVPFSPDDLQALESMLARIGESTGTKPSVGQLVSVIVRLHLDALRASTASTAPDNVSNHDVEQTISRRIVQELIDEQIKPIREQVDRLKAELHGIHAANA